MQLSPGVPSKEHLLVLNAAEGRLQMLIARRTDEGAPELRFAGQWNAPSQGAELLAPALADACERLGISPADIRRIAAVRGPGSFTGIRLALATASGLARATGAALGGIDYLPLLAANALAALGPALSAPVRLFALTHARRNLLHLQAFASDRDARLTALTDILVLAPDEAARRIAALAPPERPDSSGLSIDSLPGSLPGPLSGSSPGPSTSPSSGLLSGLSSGSLHGLLSGPTASASTPPVLVFGSGLSKNRDLLAAALSEAGLTGCLLLPEAYDHPGAEALLSAARNASYRDSDIGPLYVRGADAEDNLERIAAGLGLDPFRAKARLAALTDSSD